jgi:hypothetical protein
MRVLAIAISVCFLCIACTPASKPVRDGPPQAKVPPPPPRPSRLEAAWNALAAQTTPPRDEIRERFRYTRSYEHVGLDGFRSLSYDPGNGPQVVGFSFINKGSPRINPNGLKGTGALRKFTFLFPDRARENIYLTINDDVAISRRFSHDNMFRELHFFPRRQLPTAERIDGGSRIKVTLATGEAVVFDTRSKEIVDGVLEERPIDFNPSRYARRNPGIVYRGSYLAITVAQRGEAPRRQEVWGQKKYAEVHYPAKYAKPCRLSPALIWDQRPKPGDNDPTLTMLHKTDESLFNTIERQCRWNLADLRLPTQTRQAALGQ